MTTDSTKRVVLAGSLRYHIEGTDYRTPEDDDWHFLSARGTLSEAADEMEGYLLDYRFVRIVDREEFSRQ